MEKKKNRTELPRPECKQQRGEANFKVGGQVRFPGKISDLERQSCIFPRGSISQGDKTVSGKVLRQGVPGGLEASVTKVDAEGSQ